MTSVRTSLLASGAVALLALAACGKSDKVPTGQVVATIDGTEVTIGELTSEINTLPNRGGEAPRKLVESVALARIIERKMLAEEATKRKLDKTPNFLLAKERTEDSLLVQALQADIQRQVPATPRESAQKYIADNPQVFGDRKIFTLDQIQFLRPANVNELPLKDAKSMADVERVLIDANIEFRRAPQQLDSLTVNPKLTTEILRLSTASSEPFMFADQPAGAPAPVIYVNSVTNTQTQPFTGEKAISYAQNILQRQEIQKRLVAELRKVQDAYKPKVVYAKGYGPPEFPKAPAQAAAAKAAASPAGTVVAQPAAAPPAAAPPAAAAPAAN